MATREAMGKALWEAGLSTYPWEKLSSFAQDMYCEAAEKFAAWLEDQKREELPQEIPDALRRDLLRCPQGHVIWHPEDVEKRYCGVCREYIR